MTFTRCLFGLAVASLGSACIGRHADEVATISLDYLTSAQAEALAQPYLSSEGRLFRSGDALNTITVRDRRDNVRQVQSLLEDRDVSPENVSLQFQVVRATAKGSIDPALESVGNALRELLRFEGYQLVAQTVVSASERRVVEQSIQSEAGDLGLQLGVRINDVVDGGVDLEVELRRPGHASLLKTNVVLPMEQTVVLGSAYPGSGGDALILTVRGEMGSTELRTSRRRSREDRHAETAARAEAASADLAHELEARQADLEALSRELEQLAPSLAATTVIRPPPAVKIEIPARTRATVVPARKTPGSGASRPPGGER